MKSLKVDENNLDEICKELSSIQGKSNVNLLTGNEVIQLSKDAEERLEDMGITLKNRNGALFYYQPAGPSAMSYKFGQGATSILLVRKSKNWFVAEIHRIVSDPRTAVCSAYHFNG